MGAENFPHITDFAPDCYIKKQLHILQQKINEVQKTQKENQTVNRRWLKQKLLNEATKISKVILETHDENGTCKCSKTRNIQDFVKNAEEINLQLMLDYLYKLNGFLWQLDTDSMVKKPPSSKKPLNPLSKCFVPKYLCITENPEFQSDNLPDILKDVDFAAKKEKHNPNSSQIFQHEGNSMHHTARDSVSYMKSNDDYMLSQLVYNNLSFIEDIKKIEIHDLAAQNFSSVKAAQDAYKQRVDCYDKIIKHQNQIKALWNESNEVHTKFLNLKCQPASEKYTLDKFISSWSVNLEDKKLLNPRILLKPCGCPPCFGYNIPPIFLGNPFNFEPLCSEQNIHLSCYESNCKQLNIPTKVEIAQVPELNVHTAVKRFPETERFREFRLNKHKKDFQRFVSDVVYNISQVLNESESSENSELMGQETKSSSQNFNGTDIPQGSLSYLGSIDKHDMLNGFSRCARLGQRYLKTSRLDRQLCNTPCSVWCDFNKDKTWGWNKTVNDLQRKTHNVKSENSKHGEPADNFQSRSAHIPEIIHKTFSNSELTSTQKLNQKDDDSGYESTTMSSASSSSVMRNDGSLDLESEFWTPLPDCIINEKPQENESTQFEKSSNQQFMKNQKSLTKSFKILDGPVEQKSKSAADIAKYKTTKIRNPQIMSRRFDINNVALH